MSDNEDNSENREVSFVGSTSVCVNDDSCDDEDDIVDGNNVEDDEGEDEEDEDEEDEDDNDADEKTGEMHATLLICGVHFKTEARDGETNGVRTKQR